jgi:hypothetical protein
MIASDPSLRGFLVDVIEAGVKNIDRFVDHLGRWFPDRPLPKDEYGNPVPESEYPHTQNGTRNGRNGKYGQSRTFDEDGQPTNDRDWTDHGRHDEHTDPHDHPRSENPSGGTRRRDKGR